MTRVASISMAAGPDTYWTDQRHNREDLDINTRDAAMRMGYEEHYRFDDVKHHRQNNPRHTMAFNRGNRWIWHTERGWCVAWLTGEHLDTINYRYHRYFRHLIDALTFVHPNPPEELD